MCDRHAWQCHRGRARSQETEQAAGVMWRPGRGGRAGGTSLTPEPEPRAGCQGPKRAGGGGGGGSLGESWPLLAVAPGRGGRNAGPGRPVQGHGPSSLHPSSPAACWAHCCRRGRYTQPVAAGRVREGWRRVRAASWRRWWWARGSERLELGRSPAGALVCGQ